ncbi:hypothetical protein A2634_00195 [Candidatus Amesbacteria bacterium RIFCSPHIGHO2_01_FULL_48_32]|uniref:Uncharacterized protein n=1 Tax=Candidatus Amesbacteria bacterium RIFCSPLOWO2_01_FULL_48_25 TaxID=1797259 RepID=A0A1F4ZAH2_9BACT|nr:MAG: hypothetical protein A2634_00195 [Candidatus Amesbacteria bacterium RIFCSPHIGHO2_01_FULL_48_32]OGD03228.1 MAG: hypothetical protein A2989_00145 [Candidatus Amesbacteria bacterium RIFCSPLOWO2_01_FULL_48_25]
MERGCVTDGGEWVCKERFTAGIVHKRIFGRSLPFCVHPRGSGFEIGEEVNDELLEKLGLLTRYFLGAGTLLQTDEEDYLKAT